MSPTYVRLKVSGELACWTRPENKVERVSYECMTPSAGRNILDAICWKPEMLMDCHPDSSAEVSSLPGHPPQ